MNAPAAVYNDNDAYACAWLENLVRAGCIAPGVVHAKSIVDVDSRDLAGARQAHFFAGAGVWSAALRAAGWPDDRPVWTGSCPCQPFSGAGKGGGFDDERHLWPAWFWLIEQHRPDVIFGEQVEGPAGRAWLDLVFDDLEGAGYACGAVVFPAAGVGAPHLRHRLYWVAHANRERRGEQRLQLQPGRPRQAVSEVAGRGGTDRLADADDSRSQGWRQPGRERAAERAAGPGGVAGGLADASQQGEGRRGIQRPEKGDGAGDGAARQRSAGLRATGAWDDVEWLPCRDGKRRPAQPGLFPLASGAPARLGRLRAYGNAICLPQAQAFIESFLDIEVV